MRALESKAENDFRDKVVQRGCVYLKFSILGLAGYPDRIIIGLRRMIFFIEWKRTGEKARPLQKFRHARLREFGFRVYVIDDLDDAIRILDNEIKESKGKHK